MSSTWLFLITGLMNEEFVCKTTDTKLNNEGNEKGHHVSCYSNQTLVIERGGTINNHTVKAGINLDCLHLDKLGSVLVTGTIMKLSNKRGM